MKILPAFALMALAASVPPLLPPARGQDAPAPAPARPPIQVMVLATFHMANPGLDYANVEADDVLAPGRQREIEAVVDRLAAFAPTRVAVEAPAGNPVIADRYTAYLRGDYELGRNETYQIGFRLARRLEHPTVHSVDHRMDMAMDGVFGWAAQNGQHPLIQEFQAIIGRIVASQDSLLKAGTIGDVLRAMNEPATLDEGHGFYMRLAEVGRDSVYPGTDQLAVWYERNLRIFTNILRIAEPGDRILVIMGQSHAPILQRFLRDHPAFEVVEAYSVL
jgi:hypothetical protein